MSYKLTESTVKYAALVWLKDVGWMPGHGPELAPGELFAERSDFAQVALERCLHGTLPRLNPDPPAEALDGAFRKIMRPEWETLEAPREAQ